MKISHRIFMAVMSIFLISLIVGVIVFSCFYTSYVLDEENFHVRNMFSQTEKYMQELKGKYKAVSLDWAHWDETYRYIKMMDTQYREDNLNAESFAAINVNFMMFFGNENQVLDAVYYDFSSQTFVPFPPALEMKLMEYIFDPENKQEIIAAGDEIYIVAKEDCTDSQYKSPPAGKLIVGRRMDEEMNNAIANSADSPVEFMLLGNPDSDMATFFYQNQHRSENVFIQKNEEDTNKLSAYLLLASGDPKPDSVVLHSEVYRGYYLGQMGKLRLLLLVYILTILIGSLILLMFIYRSVILPMTIITERIRNIDVSGENKSIDVHHRGEFSALANSVNGLLSAFDHIRSNYKKIQNRLNDAQAIANIGNFEFNFVKKRAWASKQAFHIFGIHQNSSHLPMDTIYEMVHPDDRGRYIQTLQDIQKNGKSMQFEYRILRMSDGEERTILSMAKPDKDETGGVCKIIGTMQDVTERKKSESELRESERSKAVLLANLPGMAYRCKFDKDWTMQFVSEGCYELTGYNPESLLYNRDITFNDMISPDYRKTLWNQWRDTLAKHEVFKQEYTIVTASGDEKWVFEQGRGVYSENGEVEAIEGLIIDITDRKKREDEIVYLSYHDALTGLYNRIYYELAKERFSRENALPLSVIIGDINGLKLINDAFGHAKGDMLIRETARLLKKCCCNAVIARTGGDEFSILLPNTDSQGANDMLNRIQEACDEYNKHAFGDAYCINISLGHATKTGDEDMNEVINVAEDYMYKRKLLEHKSSHSAIISSIKATMFERSQETEEHAERMAVLSRVLGMKLNLSQGELDELQLLATLHDIGKVGIDNRVLNKPEPLTEEEWVEMKKHPEVGYRIAMASPELVSIADCILCHQERWDGAGYPQGLSGEDIPLLARIISIADAFDAMTQDRPYRQGVSKEEAMKEIQNNAGTQFDPRLAAIFVEMIRNNEII